MQFGNTEEIHRELTAVAEPFSSKVSNYKAAVYHDAARRLKEYVAEFEHNFERELVPRVEAGDAAGALTVYRSKIEPVVDSIFAELNYMRNGMFKEVNDAVDKSADSRLQYLSFFYYCTCHCAFINDCNFLRSLHY